MLNTKKLVLAALFLAMGMVLPFITGQIPQIGSMLLPMHIPVILCGFVCGWQYGLFVGFVSPLLRFVLFGMPPLFPVGIAMAFELAAYGVLVGLVYHKLKQTDVKGMYLSLIVAMLGGRVVWGLVMVLLTSVAGGIFTWQVFMAGAFINALPGIILQLVIIPMIMLALERTHLIESKA
ncbi:ECF transporter S component [Enterococcus sp. 669A]|uniref:ECF transporter S component n=1 Tax=Candidatus Enterococcus moelleringii TaxID=2815325 RepID=A0ABS3LFS0_9ENTE|nr:ECF transporter S component [Enterococcus sp. 669A]MBO1307219.1 ECF transporter S component [Enterococcus sp. 669A]